MKTKCQNNDKSSSYTTDNLVLQLCAKGIHFCILTSPTAFGCRLWLLGLNGCSVRFSNILLIFWRSIWQLRYQNCTLFTPRFFLNFSSVFPMYFFLYFLVLLKDLVPAVWEAKLKSEKHHYHAVQIPFYLVITITPKPR